ncbi:retrovirus-related pol polyprotein from transposon TNT 1-94 [Tanacetum coccineum]
MHCYLASYWLNNEICQNRAEEVVTNLPPSTPGWKGFGSGSLDLLAPQPLLLMLKTRLLTLRRYSRFWDVLMNLRLGWQVTSWKEMLSIDSTFLGSKQKQMYERVHTDFVMRDGETSGEFMKRFLRLAGFVVANAARNIEILRERSSQNNKRNRDGDRIRPTAQGSNQRGYDQKGYDGRCYERQDGNSNQKAWQNRGQPEYNRSSGSSGQKIYPDYASSPPCDNCGKLLPGKACHRVTGACFTCGLIGHMARDCLKNGGNGGYRQATLQVTVSGNSLLQSYFDSFDIPSDLLSIRYLDWIIGNLFSLLKSLPELFELFMQDSTLKSNKPTLQVVLDDLKLTPFYKAFEITTNIFPRLPGQKFEDPPLKEEILSFIRDLGHTREIKVLTDVNVNHMHQPWRSFAAIIIDESDTSSKKNTAPASKGSRIKSSTKMAKSDKKKQPATKTKTKGLNVLSEVALSEAEHTKLATKKSKIQFNSSHASSSGDGFDTQSKVPDEQQQNVSGTNEGAGDGPEVPDVPKYKSETEEESWTFSQGDDDDDNDEETDMNDDSEETESDNDEDNLTHPNLSTFKADDEEEEEEKANDEELSSDQRVSTPPGYELTEEEEENKEGDDKDMEGDQEQDKEDDLYKDVNINLERSDAEMTDAQAKKETEDAHVTLTVVPLVVQ